jgi:D-xylose transport system substrate-binding protein
VGRHQGGNVFEQMYTDNGGKVDGAVVANDTMAGGIIARLKAPARRARSRSPARTPASEGLQNILLGYQAGTVYKNTDLEADAASEAGDRADQGRRTPRRLATAR